jgi:hypothetical protein
MFKRMMPWVAGSWAVVWVGLLMASVFTGCSQSRYSVEKSFEPANSRPDVPEVITFSTGQPQIRVETAILMVPTSALEKEDFVKNHILQDAPKAVSIPAGSSNTLLPGKDLLVVTIDNRALPALRHAVRNDQRVLANPRLYLDSGQRASYTRTRSTNYVGSFTADVLKSGIAGVGPKGPDQIEVKPLNTGVWLEVTPTLSQDSQTLVMQIRLTVISLAGWDVAVTHDATGAPGSFVQTPRAVTIDINTVASIPDGSELVIFGPKHMEDEEVITSSWGGLFSERSYVGREYALLVAIRRTTAEPAVTAPKEMIKENPYPF